MKYDRKCWHSNERCSRWIATIHEEHPSRSTALFQPTLFQSSQLSTSIPSSMVPTKMLPNIYVAEVRDVHHHHRSVQRDHHAAQGTLDEFHAAIISWTPCVPMMGTSMEIWSVVVSRFCKLDAIKSNIWIDLSRSFSISALNASSTLVRAHPALRF